MMAAKRFMSDTRREAAEKIAAGRVRYELPKWLVDGEAVGGWEGRTLREMSGDGMISVDADGAVSLTEETVTLLAGQAPEAT